LQITQHDEYPTYIRRVEAAGGRSTHWGLTYVDHIFAARSREHTYDRIFAEVGG
jgi:hypothetical protein